MSANTSLVLNSVDFDTLKNTFKSYLRSQDRFQDYDFDGSNMNVLLDILSLNTFHNAFYLNMVGNEMFMDSAQLRDSVVSHAKDLNYTPRSFRSAQANVNIQVTSANINKRSLLIPKGTSFTSNFGSKNFTFTIGDNVLVTDYSVNGNTSVTFYGNNIALYEGYYVSDTYVYSYSNASRMLLSNKNVDTSSLTVTVIEDGGATVSTYTKATSLFDLNGTSQVFFVQGAENDSYEIIFGDGVSGKRPKDNATIVVEYRICNGELPNGCNAFSPDSTIDGEATIRVSVNSPAGAGTVSESLDSIKFNAPRHFATQERAVTTDDYENLLKMNFPEVNAVTAFGGEDLNPPQFGKVFVAVDLNEVDGLPESKKDEYYRFLKPRSPVSIDPVFVDPEYTYIGINSGIQYNINLTNLTSNDVETIVTSAIINYAKTNLNNFNRIFRYSKLLQAIDGAQSAIISNDTTINVIKVINPSLGEFLTFDVVFDIALDTTKSADLGFTITSQEFITNGQRVKIQDQSGILYLVSSLTNSIISPIGTVDYATGLLQFSNFKIDTFFNNGIKIYATPKNKDVSTINNVILNILEDDILLNVIPARA